MVAVRISLVCGLTKVAKNTFSCSSPHADVPYDVSIQLDTKNSARKMCINLSVNVYVHILYKSKSKIR